MTHHRYSSRLLVVVHSWQSKEPINLSAHVISVQTTKELKRVGAATVVLAPNENWFNLLYANDMISIYHDAGDGTGWTWLFLGYIDRVIRSERMVSDDGAVGTGFTISCSDFMKAVDRSEVVFRAELAQRVDWSIDARFAFSNVGGLGTMDRGLANAGTPDAIVEGLIGLFMGYGAQFQLPPSFSPIASTQRRRTRANRIQRALLRIPQNVRDAIARAGFGQLFNTNVQSPRQVISKLFALVDKLSPNATAQQRSDFVSIRSYSTRLISYANILEDSVGQPTSIYDAMDQSFVEGLCIDGFAQALGIQRSVGAVSNMIYGRCNELVNELFFDLRPVVAGSSGEDDAMSGGDLFDTWPMARYSRGRDMLGFNTDGFNGVSALSASTPGVQYVPAMVMREYPYSVEPGLDAENFTTIAGPTLGPVPFGPVFSQRKIGDETARVFYDYSEAGFPDGITPERGQYPSTARPYKHLDVATLKLSDMISMQVSRGDADVQNLIIVAQEAIPSTVSVPTPDLIPIFNIASIARDGVRVRDANSMYLGFSAATKSPSVAEGLYRWALLQDHWYQHNPEYLSGTISTRPRTDIRVGYRVDVPERAEAYYVMKVSHSFEVLTNGAVRGESAFEVARGQRVDPWPVWVPPSVNSKRLVETPTTFAPTDGKEAAGGNRGQSGRLAKVFRVKSTKATQTSRFASASDDDGNVVDREATLDPTNQVQG